MSNVFFSSFNKIPTIGISTRHFTSYRCDHKVHTIPRALPYQGPYHAKGPTIPRALPYPEPYHPKGRPNIPSAISYQAPYRTYTPHRVVIGAWPNDTMHVRGGAVVHADDEFLVVRTERGCDHFEKLLVACNVTAAAARTQRDNVAAVNQTIQPSNRRVTKVQQESMNKQCPTREY